MSEASGAQPATSGVGLAVGGKGTPAGAESRNPFRTANYRWWWAATICGALAVGLQFVTVPLFVVERVSEGRKEFAVAAALFSQLIASAVLMLVGGVVADRIERRSILLRCYGTAALVSTGYLFLSGFDVRQIWPVFLLAAAVGSADAFSMPARMSMAPTILPRAQLQNGIILGTVAFMSAGQFLGPSIAGFVADGPGLTYAFAAEVAFLCLAAIFASRLVTDRPTPTGRSVFGDLADGISFARRSPTILGLLFMMTLPATFLMGPVRETTVFMVRDVWEEGDKFVGVVNGSFGLGVLVGSLLLTTIRLRRRGILLTGVSTIIGGALFMAYGASEVIWVALGFQLAHGLMAALFINNGTPLLQEQAMGPMLGRVMSMSNLCFALGQPVGVVQSAIVTNAFGPQVSIVSSGFVFLLMGVFAVTFLKSVRRLE